LVKFPKGAIWRKWDAHVHTPSSILNNQFGSDWDIYVQKLFKKAIEKNISAIGITDYFFIDGYKTLRQSYLSDPNKLKTLFTQEEIERINNIFVFPNVEFRLTKLIVEKDTDLKLNKKLNFHVLLSSNLDPAYIESDFISQLHFEYKGSIGKHTEKRSLSRENLTALGNRLISEHEPFNKYPPIFVGMMNASVEESEIVKVLSEHSDFMDKYLLGLPADEDLSTVNWNSQGHNIRKNLIQQSHFIFSSNTNTIKFNLGGGDKKKHREEFGQIRPCIWGSDAHDYASLFEPKDKKFTWIKADLTFEGLKQVIYDPESRVLIQQNNPQQKSLYQVINKVRFIDNRTSPEFSSKWIEINPNLNTIIGGKSSGKSLLLCHIAKAVNYQEALSRINVAKASSYSEFEKNPELDFEVEWADGNTSNLKDKENSKPITYIPQLYINQLAEESGKNQLNMLIESILVQNVDYKQFLDRCKNKISSLNQDISNNITTLILLIEKSNNFKSQLDAIGNKQSIEEESKKLIEYANKLREMSGFTEDEKLAHEKLENRLSSLNARLEFLSRLKIDSNNIVESARQKYSTSFINIVKTIKAEHHLPENSKFIKKLFDNIQTNIEQALSDFEHKAKIDIARVEILTTKINSNIQLVSSELSPLVLKVVDQNLISETQEKIEIETEKLKSIKQFEDNIKTSSIRIGDTLEVLKNQYESLMQIYKSYETELNKPEFQIDDDLKISSRIAVDEKKLDIFFNSFDRRVNLRPLSCGLLDINGKFEFDIQSLHETIGKISKFILRGNEVPPPKTGITLEDLFRSLYVDCFSIDYIISYLGDEIIIMSPGKRGLVLLSLALHLSNSTHPILIDQPEDNLDNRTIYEQLNNYIRQRKIKRQIIMVTHNANLVVSADAESIIVANQSGQVAGVDDNVFKFEYVSGSIENSFTDSNQNGILNQKGIREHICEILEGGVIAFQEREIKYGLKH
jgi:hypothetical protein